MRGVQVWEVRYEGALVWEVRYEGGTSMGGKI